MSEPARILILTAAFGEGHNSAARNLAIALDTAGAATCVLDPCMNSLPRLTSAVNGAYRYVTNHFPSVWGKIYHSTGRHDFSRRRGGPLGAVEDRLARDIADFQPDAVVSTYPLYPYFLTRILDGKNVPVFIVVTDSIEINAAWLRARCHRWLVTDATTRESMIRGGLPAESIVETGFPVNPRFSQLTPLAAYDACTPFRILYFPTARLIFLRRHARALLDASPAVRLTLVLGRSARRLLPRALEIKRAYPGRVRLVGWTRRVPELLNAHHLVVGKAGGATVHEAIAARCPMLVHQLVPGQEEGNLQLLEIIGCGRLADTSEDLANAISDLLADRAAAWRQMKSALARHGHTAGAVAAARVILAAPATGKAD